MSSMHLLNFSACQSHNTVTKKHKTQASGVLDVYVGSCIIGYGDNNNNNKKKKNKNNNRPTGDLQIIMRPISGEPEALTNTQGNPPK